jgi:NADH-quinone oxidoreductase subunit C
LAEVLGEGVSVEEGFGPVAADVPAGSWVAAVDTARDQLGCTFFDWLSAVDELTDGFRVVCHVAARRPGSVDHLVLRTLVPRETPVVASVGHLYAGARWHERETHEMFGVEFTGPDGHALGMEKLLLPEEFEGHPLRKDFVLASRVAKPFPGAKEPGESDHQTAAPSRRRTRPAGVPEPEQWGPREPGTDKPDTLAAAAGGPAPRPRRSRRASPSPSAPPASSEEAGSPAKRASAGAGPDEGAAPTVDGPGRPATQERGRMGGAASSGGSAGAPEDPAGDGGGDA